MESVLLDDIIDKSGILGNTAAFSSEHSICAFVSWSQEFVEISYPSTGSGWVKRSDCGSHSQHRWGWYDNELYEILQLVVKHSSCLTAMFMQPLCKNCEMRHVWRQPCRTPLNVFYILALGDFETCQSYLEPLIISRKRLNRSFLDQYIRYTPKPVYHAKVVKSTPRKRKQLDKLEKEIESSVVATNRKMKTADLHSNEHEPTSLEQQQEAQSLEQQQEAQSLEQQQEAQSLEQQQEAQSFAQTQSFEQQTVVDNEINETTEVQPIQPIQLAFVFAYLPELPLPELEETTDTSLT